MGEVVTGEKDLRAAGAAGSGAAAGAEPCAAPAAEALPPARLGRVLVLGLGKTGESVARYCAGLLGCRVDSVTLYGGARSLSGENTRALEALGVRCVTGTEDVEGVYDLAVASPGIPEGSAFFAAAAAHAAEVVGEPEFAFRESPERWVAVTGTNGKTTTTSLTTHLLQAGGLCAEAVGNIGTLITSAVPARAEGGWFVAELSSFQLATTRLLHPRAAVLLNVTPDHLEWHGSMEAYAAAKERAFANLTASDLAVVGADDEWCRVAAARAEARGVPVCRVSVAEGEGDKTVGAEGADAGCVAADAYLRADGMLVVGATELVRLDQMRIHGRHNAQNALAAAACALFLGVDADAVRAGLLDFNPIEHRIEPAGTVGGVHFVNDSKATNTDSVEKALTAFEAGSVVLMLGGHDKGTDLASLCRAVCERAHTAVCFGEAGPRIAAALLACKEGLAAAGTPCELGVVEAAHLREAFDAAVACARPGQTVLLSPACSSFDEFADMGERGRAFKQMVRELGPSEDVLGPVTPASH